MYPFSGLDGRINSGYQSGQIKDKNCEYVGDIFIVHGCGRKSNVYSPPNSETVDEKQKKLRKQGMNAVPTYKVCPLSIAHVENKSRQQVDDGQRKPCNYSYHRHEITV